jgi:hypothetical protein
MKRIITVIVFAATVTIAMSSFAGTSATNTNVVSPSVQLSANIVDAVQLTLVQGASGTACAIGAGAAPPDYTMSFGTVDALAINNGACGNKYTPAQTAADAIYYTDYQLKPVFASQPSSANPTIKAYVSTNFTFANISVVRDTANSAAVPAANGFSAMSTNVAAQDTIATGVASGTPLTRYIGVDIAPTNGAGFAGAQTATITFTLTVN